MSEHFDPSEQETKELLPEVESKMSDYTEDTIADSEGAEQRSVKASISLPDFFHVNYRLDDTGNPTFKDDVVAKIMAIFDQKIDTQPTFAEKEGHAPVDEQVVQFEESVNNIVVGFQELTIVDPQSTGLSFLQLCTRTWAEFASISYDYQTAMAKAGDEIPDCRVCLATQLHDPVANGLKALNAFQFVRCEGFIHVFRREVEVEHFRQQRQRIAFRWQLVDQRVLVLRLRLGGRNAGVDCGCDLHMLGIAAELRDVFFECLVFLLTDFDVRVIQEDQIPPHRTEAFAAGALARLDNHRVALWGARNRKRAAGLEVLTVVVEAMHLRCIGETPGRLILDDRVVFPRIPMT